MEISRRDWFAGQALAGLLTQVDGRPTVEGHASNEPFWNVNDETARDTVVFRAWELADMMIDVGTKTYPYDDLTPDEPQERR